MQNPKMESAGHYLYVRHTNTEGLSYVFQYRVWNTQHALDSLADAAAKENAEARKKDKPALAKVESISEADYLRERAS